MLDVEGIDSGHETEEYRPNLSDIETRISIPGDYNSNKYDTESSNSL